MSYQVTIGLALGTSQTGLTLEAQPTNTTGANVGSAITTGFVEYGGGAYAWTGSLPDGHTGGVKFQLSGGGAFKAFAPINPQETENTDVKTSTRSTYAGGAVASVTGSVGSVAGNVTGSVGSVVADVGITQAGADKVWSSAARSLTSFGSLVADIAAAVWSAATRTLSAFGFNVTVATNQDKTGYSLASAPPSASAITNAVLNEPLSAHSVSGSVGAGISAAGIGGGGSDALNNPYPGVYADGTYGAYLRDKLNLINAGQVVIASPVNLLTNTITLIRGDAYNAATRRLLWTLTGYPDLDGAAVKLRAKGGPVFTGSVISHAANGTAQVVAVDVTAEQSAAVAGQLLSASATVVLSSGDPMTFWVGYLDARSKAAT